MLHQCLTVHCKFDNGKCTLMETIGHACFRPDSMFHLFQLHVLHSCCINNLLLSYWGQVNLPIWLKKSISTGNVRFRKVTLVICPSLFSLLYSSIIHIFFQVGTSIPPINHKKSSWWIFLSLLNMLMFVIWWAWSDQGIVPAQILDVKWGLTC